MRRKKKTKRKYLLYKTIPRSRYCCGHGVKRNDYEPIAFFTIEAARKEIIENSFDLILTDLRLPDSDGIIFLTWLSELFGHVKG